MSIERDTARDRPPGLAPRGSSAGFGIVMLYWLAVPALTCMAMIPFGHTVFDFLFPAMACPVLALLVVLPMTIGFKSRSYRGVRLFRWATIAAILFAATSILIVGGALLFSLRAPPPMVGLTWAVGALLLLLGCFLRFPLRLLRLAYWDPNASASDWETGDERINRRLVRAIGKRR